jgi:hypothetical protein
VVGGRETHPEENCQKQFLVRLYVKLGIEIVFFPCYNVAVRIVNSGGKVPSALFLPPDLFCWLLVLRSVLEDLCNTLLYQAVEQCARFNARELRFHWEYITAVCCGYVSVGCVVSRETPVYG